jgi:hypothetical protein
VRTLAVSVGAAAAVAAALVLPGGPALAAADVVARFSDIEVRQNISFASYVAGRESQRLRVRSLDSNGAVVGFRIRLVAPSGSRVQSRYALEDARNGRVFTSALGPAFGTRSRETMAAGLDPRSLFLFRLSPLSTRSGPVVTTTTARSQFWVPFPRGRGGTYVIRVQLYDRNGNELTRFRTRPLDVTSRRLRATGRFSTRTRFSSATVRG